MPYTTLPDGIRLYYEFTGPEDKPVILQFGGSLFGRQNFGLVNDGFRENFRLLSFDARGYGRSDVPSESYSIEGWADDGAALLDAVGLDRVLVHGTSMGGMIALAFACKYPERCIAACPDVAFARPDVHRKAIFRFWRRCAETMSWDDFADHVTTQAVGCHHLEKPEGENTFEMVRQITRLNSTFTVRQACLAMEAWISSRSCARSSGPILMTNGTYDMLCPPVLAKSGFSARQIAELKPGLARLQEFPDIGHADLLECPDEAVEIVTAFFHEVLAAERLDAQPGTRAPPGVPHDAPVERAVRRGVVDLGLEAARSAAETLPELLEARRKYGQLCAMNVSPPHSVASSTTAQRSSGTRPAAVSQPRRRRPAQPSGLPSAQACMTRRPSSRSATLKPCVSQSVSAASTTPPGLDDARRLAQRRDRIGDVLEHLHDAGRVVRAVGERERERVRLDELAAERRGPRPRRASPAPSRSP